MRIELIDLAVDVTTALLWQYNNATNLTGLIDDKNDWLVANYTAFWGNWYTDVFNLGTCNEFGLSVWSVILNLPVFPNDVPSPTNLKWGFGAFRKNFNNGNFGKKTNNVPQLTTEEKRLVLKLRYYRLSSRASISNEWGIPNINAFLATAFADFGRVYALDGLNMTMRYVFDFSISTDLLEFLRIYDVLPRPCGVGIKYVLTGRDSWGFGADRKNFNNGNFIGSIYA